MELNMKEAVGPQKLKKRKGDRSVVSVPSKMAETIVERFREGMEWDCEDSVLGSLTFSGD